MIITGAMMATTALGSLNAVSSFIGGQNKARAENKARIAQYKQQMLIRNVRDMGRFGVYNTKKAIHKENLTALSRRYAAVKAQDELRMNELLKGSKLASQNRLVNEAQAVGKVMAGTSSGQSQRKLRQSAVAALGRQSAARQDQLMSSVYAKEMKDDADRMSLDASRMKEYSKVRFAPQESIQQAPPAMVDGPSPMSLIAGIGSSVLSGLSMGQSGAAFDQSIASGNLQQIQSTPIQYDGAMKW